MSQQNRYLFVDQLRGLIIALMGLDHASNYFNGVWHRVTYDNYLFDSGGQFVIRFLSYLCAPGFLMLAGAMVWLSLERRVERGTRPWRARGELIRRGGFLILVQLVWVNASWSGLARIRLDHYGIIACIGTAIILLALVARWRWYWRLALALGIFLVHPLLLQIPYDPETQPMAERLMQLWIDSGSWNLYPVLPWFALATMGSVMAVAWFRTWKSDRERLVGTLLVGLAGVLLFLFVRILSGGSPGYGNIMPYDRVGSLSFFFIQKYPPSLAHNFLFFGLTMLVAVLFMLIGKRLRWIFHPFEVYGRTPFFFYAVHIPLLAILTKRTGLLPYREGEVGAALLAWVGLLILMYPLCRWFGAVKARSRNTLIRMM
ncbi:MAG: DUF1624 domain-containing protein [Candidatus Eisenbacteria bacterium]|nr:DUF1624 domain-containing protein [Candidatus Eisenbacteria bacterium]